LTLTLRELEENEPFIAWREPQPVTTPGREVGIRYACRVCIANEGLTARKVDLLPVDREVALRHLREVHGA